jgi:hypothetical protein
MPPSVRKIDQDGRMHIRLANISKANVCPYYGNSIPNFKALGLNPETVYNLYRHPEELVKAASTFNNIPLLNQHIPVDVEDHHPDAVVGSTGTDCQFVAPYLQNSLVVWTEAAIEAIELNEQKELSCMYYYRADMTPGYVDGYHYDGIMRDIVGNHVALVPVGRAGRDVVIGDSEIKINNEVRMKKLSKMAIFAKGALMGADAAINYQKVLGAVTAANWVTSAPAVLAAIRATMAADADIAPLEKLFTSLAAEAVLMAKDEADEDEADETKKKKAADKEVPPKPAEDDEDDEDKVSKGAMDSALKAIEASTIKRMTAVRKAEREVSPYVGGIEMAADSAEGIYAEALSILGVDVTGVHPSALGTILRMQNLPGSTTKTLAADAALITPASELAKKLPGYRNIKQL